MPNNLNDLKQAFVNGPTPTKPKKLHRGDELTFGKWQGRLVKDILNIDPGYIWWLINNTSIKVTEKVRLEAQSGYLKSCADRRCRHRSYGRSSYRYVDYDHDAISDWGPGEFDGGGNMGFW